MTPAETPKGNELKPNEQGFRYVLMWMTHVLNTPRDSTGYTSYVPEWQSFVRDCQRELAAANARIVHLEQREIGRAGKLAAANYVRREDTPPNPPTVLTTTAVVPTPAEMLSRIMVKLREDASPDDPMEPFAYDSEWEQLASEADAAIAMKNEHEAASVELAGELAAANARIVHLEQREVSRAGKLALAQDELRAERERAPDLSLLAKRLHCGLETPYAKLLEVAEGAVNRAEAAEAQLRADSEDAARYAMLFRDTWIGHTGLAIFRYIRSHEDFERVGIAEANAHLDAARKEKAK